MSWCWMAGFENPVARKLHQPMTLYKNFSKRKVEFACFKKSPQDREVQSLKTGEMLPPKEFESRRLREKDKVFRNPVEEKRKG